MINLPVLVLNQTYEPLNICRVRRAMVLIYQDKAEMLENGYGTIRTIDRELPVPSVIKLSRHIKRPYQLERKLTRMEIFRQYCGKITRNLTLDHVIPRSRNGQHTWENVVSACVPCNRIKAGRTPEEAGMKLRTKPAKPRPGGLFFIPSHYSRMRTEWGKYLPQVKVN
jgi:5-methylcytosine-specific restriction endonuclease McrA